LPPTSFTTRATPTGDPRTGDLITYDAKNLTMQAFGLPFFYLPRAAGEMTEKGFRFVAWVSGTTTISAPIWNRTGPL